MGAPVSCAPVNSDVMRHKTLHFVSPSFTHEKLEPPFYRDVVDVFEDRMLHWLILPARELLKVRHGEVAAVALATNYLEAIEIYISGKDSSRQSRVFFIRGFKRVFAGVSGPEFMHEAIASSLYELLRCGFAHEGTFRHGIYFSSVRKEAFTVTWPKKGGAFDPDGKLESAIINPRRFIEGVEGHFRDYIRQLRRPTESEVQRRFKEAVALKWHLNGQERHIGMTEEDFYRAA